MENVPTLSDLSWYIGPALVAARVTSRWNHDRLGGEELGLRTAPNILRGDVAFGSARQIEDDALVPSIWPLTHPQTKDDGVDQVVLEIDDRNGKQQEVEEDVEQLLHLVKQSPQNTTHALEARRLRKILDEHARPGLQSSSQQCLSPSKDTLQWTPLWLDSTAWNLSGIWGKPFKSSAAKVIRFNGPGNGLVTRSSPPFVYPDHQNDNFSPAFIVCFNMTGALSVPYAETALRAQGIIGRGKLVKTERNRPDVLLASAAKPGAYEVLMASEAAEVFICRFQPEHIGHRGCLAAGYSYFLCGLNSRTPPYRVVAAGYCGQSRFILSRSYAGDCPRLPLFHCHFNENNSNNNTSNKSVSNSIYDLKSAVNSSPNQCSTGEKVNSLLNGGTSTKGRSRVMLFCDVASNGQLVSIKRSSDTAQAVYDPPYKPNGQTEIKRQTLTLQHMKQSSLFDNLTDCSTISPLETDVLKERLQAIYLNGEDSQLAGSVLALCILNCVEKKSSSTMLREMAVLLNDERTLVTFDLRFCGLCAPSRALLNETRALRKQAFAVFKQQSSVINDGKAADSITCTESIGDRREKAGSETRTSPEVAKYFNQRYRLISRFKNDLQLSEEAWFSICPEEIGKHIARRIVDLARNRGGRLLRIMDPCCGAGGNAVHCAAMPEVEHVYANDLKEHEVASARRLAALYGVKHKITFHCGDLFKLRPEDVGHVDALVFSPPWGGPEYLGKPTFDINEMTPSYSAILRHCSNFSTNMAVLLPRNVCLDQLVASADEIRPPEIEHGDDVAVELELNLIGKKCKTATVYYGKLVNRAVHQG